MSGVLVYRSCNSGGYWWLKDQDWKTLAKNGWVIHWGEAEYDDQRLLTRRANLGKRWLDALATSAAIATERPESGIKSWIESTGCNPSERGCSCCGRPHSFEWYPDDGGDNELIYVDELIPE